MQSFQTPPFKQKLTYLIDGYVKMQLMIFQLQMNDNMNYVMDLNDVIAVFLGNIFFAFDIIHESHAQYLLQNGTVLRRNGVTNTSRYDITACSSNMFLKGINEFEIKCVQMAHNPRDAIGIMSNTDICQFESKWCAYAPADLYCYCGNGQLFTSYDTSDPPDDQDTIHVWQVNDVIKVSVDCDVGEVTFYRNNQKVGAMNIIKNVPYYAFIAAPTCGFENH
eukprot:UN08733